MSANKDDTLRQFCDVTGADEARSRFFLESSNWQLEVALSSFYEHGGNADEAPAHPVAAPASIPVLSDSDMESPPGSPLQPQKKDKKKTTNTKFATLNTLQQESSSDEEEELTCLRINEKTGEYVCNSDLCPERPSKGLINYSTKTGSCDSSLCLTVETPIISGEKGQDPSTRDSKEKWSPRKDLTSRKKRLTKRKSPIVQEKYLCSSAENVNEQPPRRRVSRDHRPSRAHDPSNEPQNSSVGQAKDRGSSKEKAKDQSSSTDQAKDQNSSTEQAKDRGSSKEKAKDQSSSTEQAKDQSSSKEQTKLLGSIKEQAKDQNSNKEQTKAQGPSKVQGKDQSSSKKQGKGQHSSKEEAKDQSSNKEQTKGQDSSKEQDKDLNASKEQGKRQCSIKKDAKDQSLSKEHGKDQITSKEQAKDQSSSDEQSKCQCRSKELAQITKCLKNQKLCRDAVYDMSNEGPSTSKKQTNNQNLKENLKTVSEIDQEETERLKAEISRLKLENSELKIDIARLKERSDDGAGQAFYAGGSERSGQQILGPGKSRKDIVTEMFKSVRERGAVVFEEEPSSAGRGRGGGVFSGVGYRLGQTSDDHEQVTPSNTQPTAQGQQGRSVRLRLYREGFTVDNGALRHYTDPENAEFLSCIRRGEIPPELSDGGGEVRVSLEDRRHEECPRQGSKSQAFTGKGHLLGSPTPTTVGATAPVAADASDRSANQRNAQAAVGLDEGQPVTTIQFRLADGSRITGRFNHSHTVADLQQYVSRAEPAYQLQSFALLTTFPSSELSDPTVTLASANLLNTTLLQRLK